MGVALIRLEFRKPRDAIHVSNQAPIAQLRQFLQQEYGIRAVQENAWLGIKTNTVGPGFLPAGTGCWGCRLDARLRWRIGRDGSGAAQPIQNLFGNSFQLAVGTVRSPQQFLDVFARIQSDTN